MLGMGMWRSEDWETDEPKSLRLQINASSGTRRQFVGLDTSSHGGEPARTGLRRD
jgi:hypothetical protein